MIREKQKESEGRRSPKIMPHVDHNGRKSHMKLQLRVTLRLTSKTVDYFDVGDVEDALRDYLSKFEWGGGHMSTLRGVGWQ